MPALQDHRFAGADWPDIIRRLTFVSMGLFKAIGLLGPDAVMKGLGVSPEDLAYETVAKVLADEVRYRKDKGPLLPFLILALKRDFLDLLRQKSWLTTDIVDGDEGPQRQEDRTVGINSLTVDDPVTPDFILRKRIMEQVKDDQQLVDYAVAALEMNVTKPADFADLLSTTVADIQNRKKRLFRALSKAPNLRGV
jgi:DNA-directed RNA polymerase specialized sigma24 family protein